MIRSLINHWVLSCECETQQVSILNTFSRSHLSSQLHSLFLEWNTIFEFDRLQKSQTASLHFLKCMVEYLEPGQDKQYCVHMVAIEFFDGDQEQDSRELESRKSSFLLYSTPCMNMSIQTFSLARMNCPKERFNLFSDSGSFRLISI